MKIITLIILLLSIVPTTQSQNSLFNSGMANKSKNATSNGLPENWNQKTIGQSIALGTAYYENKMFTVSGSGADIWNTQEEFHYVYTTVTDGIEIIAKIESFQNANEWSKAGIAIRQNDLPKSESAFITYSPNQSNTTAVRSIDGNGLVGQVIKSGGSWLRIVYKNNFLAFYTSTNGTNWNKVGLRSKLKIVGTFSVGLVVSSHQPGSLCQAAFSDVVVRKPDASITLFDGGQYFEKKIYIPKELPKFNESLSLLPEPMVSANPEWVDLYWVAWESAFDHFRQPVATSTLVSNWLDDAFSDDVIIQWDMVLSTQYAKYAHSVFPAIEGLDNFYANQKPDGLINRVIIAASGEDHWWGLGPDNARAINPPIYAWGEYSTYKISADTARLAKVLPALEKYFEWVEKNRRGDDTPHKLYWSNGQASGLDNTPRDEGRPYPGDGWDSHSAIDHMGWVDISSQLVKEANSLASICDVLVYTEKAQAYRTKASNIGALMNKWMWNESDGLYYDVNVSGIQTKWKTVAAFWPLIAGITDTKQEARLIDNLKDPNTFGRDMPVPTLAADQKYYSPRGSYWKGGAWPPTTYAVIKGLEQQGYYDLARQYSETYITGMSDVYKKTNAIWELYAPDKENGAFRQGTYDDPEGNDCAKWYVGWSALAPIALLIENVIGLDVDAPNNTVTWQLSRTDKHGLNNLRFGDITTSIIANERSNDDSVTIDVQSTAPYKLKVNFQGKDSFLNVVKGDNTFTVKTAKVDSSIKKISQL